MSASTVFPASTALPAGRSRDRVRTRSTTSIRTRYRRQTAALMVGATVLGLWYGVAAPSVSPVTPAVTDAGIVAVSDPLAGTAAATGASPQTSTTESTRSGSGTRDSGTFDGQRTGGGQADGHGGRH